MDTTVTRKLSVSLLRFSCASNNYELFVNSSFNEEELTVVWQSINVEHACHYCVPAHTGIAAMMKVDEAITLRNETAFV
jgi:hypothetical protein